MRIPEYWLRSFCSPDWSSEQLADRLTMAGLEVEAREAFAPEFSGIVVADIIAVAPHPNADKLRVCQVDVGAGATQEIVCGAPNAAPGLRVPCALPGAILPGGMSIKPVKMRGVQSNGMLCSARELGLSEDHAGLMELATTVAAGTDFRKALGLDEQIFTLKLTPNLAHCLSVYGVAREVSALSGVALSTPSFEPVPVGIDDRLAVKVVDSDLCGRFSGRVIRGVDARATTPGWMADRLIRAGQRPIAALVDISNYVMLELGRPSHVFDLDRIEGGLTVRWARAGESLELLNGQTVTLDPGFGVIVDERGLESLAGIMGGNATAVDDQTTNVYVEAAFWWPDAIAGRARRLNFSTDASHRFERGVDPATTVEHLEYVSRLIVEICGGKAGPVDDQVTVLPPARDVTLRFDRARKVIGQPISDETIISSLGRLGLPLRLVAGGFGSPEPGTSAGHEAAGRGGEGASCIVAVPSHRFDLKLEEDLIEEVARIYGYENLPLRPPIAASPMSAVPEARRSVISVKRALAARDYQEVINYSFGAGEIDRLLSDIPPIALLNPIAKTLDVMRTTLLGGLLGVLRSNLNRKSSRVRVFETGKVFLADSTVASGPLTVAGLRQPERLAALAYGSAVEDQWGERSRQVDFHDLKQDLTTLCPDRVLAFETAEHVALHPGRSARICIEDGSPIGWIGELHPAMQQQLELSARVQLFEIDLDALLARAPVVYQPVSRFPPSIRDIAVVVDNAVPAAAIYDEIWRIVRFNEVAKPIHNIMLFDEYRGKGLENKEKSLAFRLWMQDTGRTLEDGEVGAAVDAVVQALGVRFGARLR